MTDLLPRAMEIHKSLGNHVKDAEKIEKEVQQRYPEFEIEQTTIPVLKQGLKKTTKKADEMKSEVKKQENEVSVRIASLEETVRAEQQSRQKFQNQVEKMQEQLNETQCDLLKMKGDLHTGQTAYNFEKHLAAHIYPPGTPVTHGRIFTTLMKWLKANKHTREGRDASRRWEELKKEFGWSNDKQQTAVFFKMLKCREEYAHPEVNFALPISKNFTDSEKKCVQVIRNMTIKLNEHVNQHDLLH